jgi:FkbM family methyltransferase
MVARLFVRALALSMTDAIDHPHQWFGGRTYAQHGDDLAILNIFKRLRIERPSYLDIGAHHPFELSNTALLYKLGSRGINVEANPALMAEFERHRPGDKNVCVAVGPVSGSATLHRINETCGLNSLKPVPGELLDAIPVQVMTADRIVDIYAGGRWPELLSIDAEGMDVEILASINYQRSFPKVICAEAVSQNGSVEAKLRDLVVSKGYFLHSWAGSNMIFVRHEYLGRIY